MNKYEYSEKTIEVFNTLIEKVLIKAENDQEFRKLCLEDGKKAFEIVTGIKWPEDASELRFSETEKEGSFTLTKPGGELSDDDLDNVSGGVFLAAAPKDFNIGSPEIWSTVTVDYTVGGF